MKNLGEIYQKFIGNLSLTSILITIVVVTQSFIN